VSTLEKAVLEELDKSGKVTETIPVQFNPASLKLQMTNSTDGGAVAGPSGPAVQRLGEHVAERRARV